MYPLISKLNVRVNKCCKRSSTRPTENSTAEKIKKKNVNEIKFKQSYAIPTNKTRAYKVIQINSAVKSRCNAVFKWVVNVVSRIKKMTIRIFKSPKNKINLN